MHFQDLRYGANATAVVNALSSAIVRSNAGSHTGADATADADALSSAVVRPDTGAHARPSPCSNSTAHGPADAAAHFPTDPLAHGFPGPAARVPGSVGRARPAKAAPSGC